MARLDMSGFELNAPTAQVEFSQVGGTPAFDSTASFNAGGLGNHTNVAGASSMVLRKFLFSTVQSDIAYQRIRIKPISASSSVNLLQFVDTGNANLSHILALSNGRLRLRNSGLTQVGADSMALNDGRWHIAELKHDASTNPGSLEARIDGAVFASGANDVQGSYARAVHGFGANSTLEWYTDDWAINNNSGTVQNGYPGDSYIGLLYPVAAGSSNQWLKTAGGAGDSSNYQLVDEQPPNDATDYVQSGTVNDLDMYKVNDLNLPSNAVINCVQVSARLANLTAASATTAVKIQCAKTSGGTRAESTAIIPNSTTWRTNNSTTLLSPVLTLYNDPDGNPWTPPTIKSMEIGVKLTAFATNKIAVSGVWAYVDYSLPAKQLTTLGVG